MARIFEDLPVDILNVKKPQHARKLCCLGDSVATAVLAVSRIQTQSDSSVRGYVEEALALFRRLDVGSDVRMKHEIQPELARNLGRFLHNPHHILPLSCIEPGASITRHPPRQPVAFIR